MCITIVAITFRNRIYAWTLGDIPALYEEAIGLYKSCQYKEALPIFEKLAKLDTAAYSKFILGDMYYRGLACEVDYQKALTSFQEAAELNNTDAHNNLGVMYLSGHGVQADYSKAFRHFQYGAANGNPQAQLGLGTMYRHGWGIARNSSTAFDWYRKAAAHGNVDAMNNLGYMYISGCLHASVCILISVGIERLPPGYRILPPSRNIPKS